MERAFTNYEELTCDMCGESFTGRCPSEPSADILCSKCMEEDSLPIEETTPWPERINAEIFGGRGEDDE